jgi:hypothetical protein
VQKLQFHLQTTLKSSHLLPKKKRKKGKMKSQGVSSKELISRILSACTLT